ncbi:MAG: DUF4199 domain-containing protein [Bacteroidales bacterium]|nr:DUF4199 domain-containing protein [Bacteroidales bacterium]
MEKKSMYSQVANYGLITGLILVAYTLLLYITGQLMNKGLGYISLVILAACLYIFTKQYRDKINGGTLTYGQGFSVGVLTGIFAGILSAFFSLILYMYIDPSLVDKQLSIAEQDMLSRGMSEEQVEMAINMTKKWMTPGMMFLSGILSMAFLSALISLITAAILKKNPSPFEQSSNNI